MVWLGKEEPSPPRGSGEVEQGVLNQVSLPQSQFGFRSQPEDWVQGRCLRERGLCSLGKRGPKSARLESWKERGGRPGKLTGHPQQRLFWLLLMVRNIYRHSLATEPQRSRWGPEQMPGPIRGPLYLSGKRARCEVGAPCQGGF